MLGSFIPKRWRKKRYEQSRPEEENNKIRYETASREKPYKPSIPPDKMKYAELIAKVVGPVHEFRAGYPLTHIFDRDEEAHHYAMLLIAACDMPAAKLRVYHRRSVWECTPADVKDIRESLKSAKCVVLESRYNPETEDRLKRMWSAAKKQTAELPGVLYITDLTDEEPYIAKVGNNSPVAKESVLA